MSDQDHPARPAAGRRLIGRDRDLEFIRSHLDGSAVHGAALLLSGEAGIGKTALLDTVAAQATQRGVRVLRASGVQFEADISYAGLNQLLVPLFDSFDRLDRGHRDALRVAVGIGGGPPPNRLLTSTAALMLLRLIADDTPLLVVVDDLPWLDRATTSVLGFVARRLIGSRISFLAASRVTSDGFFESSGLTEHRLQPLDEVSSAELLAHTHPEMSLAVRRRVIAAAYGNPLALVELSGALEAEQRTTPTAVPSVLPLSERLQTLFAARVADLPEPSRELLLIAALEGTGDLAVIEAAGAGRAVIDDLEPAERDWLISISPSSRRLSFRHPLIGSAVVAQATAADRRRAHQALAAVLTDQPERRACHLGEAATGPDETVADLLEQAARLRLARGDALGAVAALTRAAGLSPASADESRRLAEAAYIGADAGGELADASRLLAGARQADPAACTSLHAAAASALLLINKEGDINTAHRLLVGAIETGGHRWDASDGALIEALFTLITLCWYSGDPQKWPPLFRALDRLTPGPPDLLRACAQIIADPARTGHRALDTLDALLTDVGQDPTRVIRVSNCAVYPERLADVREGSVRLVEEGRAGTAPARRHLAALMHLCLVHYPAGRWEEVVRLAGEGLVLCEEHGYRFFACKFQYMLALVAAARGDTATSTALSQEIVGWAAPRGAHGAQVLAFHTRALAALGAGDFEAAYRHATALSPAGTLAPYLPQAMAVTMDLVEAAIRTGRPAEAAAHAAAMRESAMPRLAPRLAMLVLACEALTTPGDDAFALFEKALRQAEPGDWPFDVARIRLFYGERLRRRRVTKDAREQLAQASKAFKELGAAPWVTRATAELRASGHGASAAAQPGKGALTAQEREIATLAATGLTNKQIAERLFLSHRTIGTHLYQIYPKLGINSRASLRDALAALDLEDIG
ncbi:helix-turn-helix transcriptional regulator [Streptomyces sp. NPDC048521]|uniref:helix-turn-helix transcriptional regulator n=1 Tax=Streptomyces sp. NPDC048521 TaxID=3365566 RepID=UPI0037234AD6